MTITTPPLLTSQLLHTPPTRRLFTYNPTTQQLEFDIDNTSLEHFTTCARASEYRLVRSREGTRSSAALHYGGAKHLYLEHVLKGGTVADAEQKMVDYLTLNSPDDIDEWRTVTHAIESMRGYERFWHANPLEVVSDDGGTPLVELGFRLPLCYVPITQFPPYEVSQLLTNPLDLLKDTGSTPSIVKVFWTGRIDVIVRHLGDTFVMDHKTTSMVGPSFYDDFNLSSQTIGYTWAAGHLFPDLNIRGLRVNIIIGRKPSKAGVAHAYERQTYVYSVGHLAEWHRNTQVLVSDFLSHLLRGYFPMQTKWCQGKYGQCQYYPTCTALPGASRDIVLDSNLYQDVTWSPLANRI